MAAMARGGAAKAGEGGRAWEVAARAWGGGAWEALAAAKAWGDVGCSQGKGAPPEVEQCAATSNLWSGTGSASH